MEIHGKDLVPGEYLLGVAHQTRVRYPSAMISHLPRRVQLASLARLCVRVHPQVRASSRSLWFEESDPRNAASERTSRPQSVRHPRRSRYRLEPDAKGVMRVELEGEVTAIPCRHRRAFGESYDSIGLRYTGSGPCRQELQLLFGQLHSCSRANRSRDRPQLVLLW